MKKILKKILPKTVIKYGIVLKIKLRLLIIREKILKSYSNQNKPIDIEQIIEYIKKYKKIDMISYEFAKKYENLQVQIYKDEDLGLYYVIHKGNRMYFKKSMSLEQIESYYRIICLEQDFKSPHRYLDEENDFSVVEGDVVLDIGSAEGNFILDNIEKISEAYLFEFESEWIDALKATFKPFENKVHIIQKYVSDCNQGNEITIDSFLEERNKKIDFLKMDIEGSEMKALRGAVKTLNQNEKIKLAICTYHNEDDECKFKQWLSKFNFRIDFSEGYIIPIWDLYKINVFGRRVTLPLRKGVLRAKKL